MKQSIISENSKTDWERVDALADKDINFSDVPEAPTEMFAQAVVRRGLKSVSRKAQVTLRVDSDVLD